MLFRIVMKPHNEEYKQSWNTVIICTKCGQKNKSSTFKSEALTSMTVIRCFNCGENLDNQEHLNKKFAARISYHESK